MLKLGLHFECFLKYGSFLAVVKELELLGSLLLLLKFVLVVVVYLKGCLEGVHPHGLLILRGAKELKVPLLTFEIELEGPPQFDSFDDLAVVLQLQYVRIVVQLTWTRWLVLLKDLHGL